MKKLLLTGIAALSVLSAPAAHARMQTSMPPAEYDKPYTGELIIRRLTTEQDVRDACPKAFKASQTRFSGCTVRKETRCEFYIASDRALKALGMSYALVLRHELAHCNGWPWDHPGGKKVPIDTSVEMPKLPPSTKELPAYPPTVCVTPEWNQEPCKDRKPYWPS